MLRHVVLLLVLQHVAFHQRPRPKAGYKIYEKPSPRAKPQVLHPLLTGHDVSALRISSTCQALRWQAEGLTDEDLQPFDAKLAELRREAILASAAADAALLCADFSKCQVAARQALEEAVEIATMEVLMLEAQPAEGWKACLVAFFSFADSLGRKAGSGGSKGSWSLLSVL